VAVAVAMVAAALFIRDRLDESGDENGRSGGPGSGAGGAPLVVCVPELEAACQAIEADGAETRVEPAGATFDALVAGAADLDGWLTLAPWPAMVEGALARDGRPAAFEAAAPPPLARTPVVLVGVADRLAALRDRCGGEPYWRCIGEHLGDPVRPAHDPADRSATGLLVLGSAVTDFFGEVPRASNDFQDPGFQGWFTGLERSTTFTTNFGSLVEHLLVRPSTFNAVGTIEAPAVEAGARRDGYTILYPSPMATADAVLVWARGDDTDRFDALAGEVLVGNGWRSADDDGLPDSNGLPPAGVLEALRTEWIRVVR
jgi:hypothetical protein